MAPDGQTMVKILSAIGEEYNVKWDAKSSQHDSRPQGDERVQLYQGDIQGWTLSSKKSRLLHKQLLSLQTKEVQLLELLQNFEAMVVERNIDSSGSKASIEYFPVVERLSRAI